MSIRVEIFLNEHEQKVNFFSSDFFLEFNDVEFVRG